MSKGLARSLWTTSLTFVKKVRQDGRMPTTLPLLEDATAVPCCAPLASIREMSVDDAIRLAGRLKALADPVRLRLVTHLLGSPGYEACTCDLAPLVGVSDATVSH